MQIDPNWLKLNEISNAQEKQFKLNIGFLKKGFQR